MTSASIGTLRPRSRPRETSRKVEVTAPGHATQGVVTTSAHGGNANHPDQQAESVAKDAEVVALVNAGKTLAQIAGMWGVSTPTIWRRFHRALERVPVKGVEEYRAGQIARLAAARQAVIEVLTAKHVVVSNGHIVSEINGTYPAEDENGEPHPKAGEPIYGDPLVDDGPVLAAVDRLVKLDDQEAKLLGLYAAVKVEQDTTLRYEVVSVAAEDVV